MLNLKRSIFLMVCLMAAVVANAASWTGGTEEPTKYEMDQASGISYMLIENAEQLAWIAARVNSGATELYIKLNADIVIVAGSISISSRTWTPIGNTETNAFKGVFDGNGHSVSGIYSKESLAGFFGVIDSLGIVKNLKLSNGLIQNTNIAGGVAAINKGTIENCKNGFLIKDGKYVGGITGYNAGRILNSTNNVTISSGTSLECYNAGIAGFNKGEIISCKNNGDVSFYLNSAVYKDANCAGIASYNSGKIIECVNTAYISASHRTFHAFAGGIVTYNYGLIDGCENKGAVFSSGSKTGGIAAYSEGTISRCNNEGSIKLFCDGGVGYAGGITGHNIGGMKKIFNYGEVYVYQRNEVYGGGICGANFGIIEDAFNTGSIAGSASLAGDIYTAGIVSLNSSRAKVSNVYNASSSIEASNKGWESSCKAIRNPIFNKNANQAVFENSFTNTTLLNLGAMGANTGVVNNINGMTSAEMVKDSLAWVLNTRNGATENSNIWTRVDGENSGFPIFTSDSTTYKPIYRVTFDDGVATRMSRYSNHKGEVSYPEKPISEGKGKFVAWIDSDGYVYKEGTLFSKDESLFAKYALETDNVHTVTFKDSTGEDLFTLLTDENGYLLALPNALEVDKDHYFKGWFTEDMEPINDKTIFNSDVNVIAVIGELKNLKYYVVFVNANGDTLQSDSVGYGVVPVFESIPTQESSTEFNYTFESWTPNIVATKEDAVYTAVYLKSIREYSITFIDYDESLICEATLPYGTSIEFCGNLPSREKTEIGSYSFARWDKSLTTVTGDATYKAVYDSVMNAIVVEFRLDGVSLQTKSIAYGTDPVYSGQEPYKDPSAKFEYNFAGWVLEDCSTIAKKYYTAVFDSTLRAYKVTFKVDGEVVQSKSVFYGSTPVYSGDEPTRAKSENYTYEFAGWTPEIKSVTGAQTYTAVFDSTKIEKPASSSSVPNSSSSSGKGESSSSNKGDSSSSGDKGNSSSSDKTALDMVWTAPQFNVEVVGRTLLVAGVENGAVYNLMDMQGRLLKQGTTAANFTVEVPHAGSYLLRIGKSISRVSVK